jgi:hypothetical protein
VHVLHTTIALNCTWLLICFALNSAAAVFIQVTDGASAVLMMTRREALNRGLPVLGIFRSFSAVGVDPAIMGVGPAVAIPAAVAQVRRAMVAFLCAAHKLVSAWHRLRRCTAPFRGMTRMLARAFLLMHLACGSHRPYSAKATA